MPIAHETDHAGIALGKLVEQFKDRSKFRAFCAVFLKQYQDIEDALWQLFSERWIDSAAGAQLDVIGRIVDQPRDNSPNDDDYRARIRARVRVNRSSGTIKDIIAVFHALLPLGPLSTFVFQPGYPAGFDFVINQVITPASALLYASFLRDSHAAGIGANLIWQPADDAASFTFESGLTFLVDYFDSTPGQTIRVRSTVLFPASGSFRIGDGGDGLAETVAYSSKNATHFLGVTSTQEHFPGERVFTVPHTSPGLGFGDGELAGAAGA